MRRRILMLISISVLLALISSVSAAETRGEHAKRKRPYFVGDFENCDFSQWHRQGPDNAFAIVRTPTVDGRCAGSITVGPSAQNGMVNPLADGAALWLEPEPYGENGHRVWQHFSINFARGFKASPGEWNFFVQWHNDNGWKQFADQLPQKFEFANLCWMIRKRNGVSRIIMRIIGGQSTSPKKIRVVGPRLRTDHWYEFLVRTVWSPDARQGLVEWWLDGKRLYAHHVPTLYTRPDGTVSSVYFIQDNYRLHSTATTSIFFDGTRLGHSRSSVAY